MYYQLIVPVPIPDCATFTLNGQRFFWAIDYYDETCTYRSKDPCDDFVTTRVLTLMLAEDD